MTPRSAGHFSEARFVILGFELQPYSLWHRRSLEVIRSPLVTGAEATFADLFLAAKICAARVETPLRELVTPTVQSRLHARLLWLIFGKRWKDEATLFEDYLDLYEAGPRRTGNADGGSWPLESPPVLYYHRCLVKHLGMSAAEAWSTSPGLARWKLAIEVEVNGRQPGIRTREVLREYIEAGYVLSWEDY